MGNEWAMMLFTSLVCLSAGLSVVTALGEWRDYPLAPLVRTGEAAAALLALGFLSILFSLGRPQLFIGMLGNAASSFFPVAVLMALAFAALFGFCAAHYRGAEFSTTRGFALAAGICSSLLVLAAGRTMVMPWREAWNTPIIPAAFLAWAFACCCYAAQALSAVTGRSARLGRASRFAWAVPAVLVAAYIAFLFTSEALREDETAWEPLTGSLAPIFWLGVAGAGIVLPAVLTWRGKGSARACLAAMILTVAGAAAFHMVVWQLGMPSWDFFSAS
ncbi:hypothetical protein MUN46_009720 [Mesosutterella sp. AGMB02718]|uniref:Uncharacterized protein n=1 Tax=Mesosutterella faecium TaxID=2925194 RepID=A0ABT7IQN7_9BURK|nr:hypothetical protein [Mesosutterella sp. AGMB02718]MDL2060211.1 hypothetical protein [Mesosutterella sp. AGMB02718]